MAKRDTVSVNCEKVSSFIKMNEWTKAAFSRKVGKYSSWFAEVLRGNNLPSPEEAARMCVLLQTTPEEILSEEADIELVRSLIEQEREKGIKKDPIPKDEVVSPAAQEIFDFLDSASGEELADVIKYIRYLKSQRG